MKFTIVSDVDPRKQMIGGIPNYVRNICLYLKKKNFEIQFIGRIRGVKGKNTQPYGSFIGINSKSNYGFLFRLFQFLIKKMDTDIIFSQRADFIVPFIFKKCKKVIIYHGIPSTELSHKKGSLTAFVYNLLEKIAVRSADKIIVVSSTAKDYLENKYRLKSKIVLIPSAVDTAIFKFKDKSKMRKKYGFKPNDKIALYAGRFSPEKQIGFIIDQARQLKGVKLVLVGGGSVSVSSNERLIVMEPVNHYKLSDIINCSDCLVLFSKYEGMPNVVLEALACGKPVVSSDVGDIKKVVINGKTGFIANRENFAQLLKKVLDKPLIYRQECIKIVQEYSWSSIGAKTLKVLSE